MKTLSWLSLFFATASALCGCTPHTTVPSGGPVADWPTYGRDGSGSRYSPLTQITRENVNPLRVAWPYRTGDVPTTAQLAAFQATPILVDGTLYLSTPFNRVVALDSETGTDRWTYDPELDRSVRYSDFPSRGVSPWRAPVRRPSEPCRQRIFAATTDARLSTLDAATGVPCPDFGAGGHIDLSRGVGKAYAWEYGVSSPPAVIHDLVIVGEKVADNQRVDAPSGVVRAFASRTGALRWSWDAVPPARSLGVPYATDTYHLGTANAWSMLSVDPVRGLVFVPNGWALCG